MDPCPLQVDYGGTEDSKYPIFVDHANVLLDCRKS